MSHLGARVSALLDGRLGPAEEERCWEHVRTCRACRELVEREGWVKTRLASWTGEPGSAPDHLKYSLLSPGSVAHRPPVGSRGMMLLSGSVAGAVGVAVAGVIALGLGPTPGPMDRRAPITHVSGNSPVSWLMSPSMRAARSYRVADARPGILSAGARHGAAARARTAPQSRIQTRIQTTGARRETMTP